ncbi:AFG1-like ATPase-domain-containing protein [Flagelloscypha sp. PMI_526]|nr:AFG1-like ATPase-domain-containing protein [Flagelloscypha sp. PMI_526]
MICNIRGYSIARVELEGPGTLKRQEGKRISRVRSLDHGGAFDFFYADHHDERSRLFCHRQPVEQYVELVDAGTLRQDTHQTHVVKKLQTLYDNILAYHPPPIPDPVHPGTSLLSRLLHRGPDLPLSPPTNAPKSLYLFGDVGSGKTMLMDLFFHSLPDSLRRKRRIHFHAFMIDVHKRIHAAKIKLGLDGGDPIPLVARDLADEAYILCFDEFQVTDIADAMVLRRLLETLLNFGVIFVMTSNRHPEDLYKNGIQRSSFLPAIELLKSQFVVFPLDSGTDYRRIPRALAKVYYNPLNDETRREIDKLWTLTSWGRKIVIPESNKEMARFKFHDLCGNKSPMGASDYIEVTQTFKTIFITDIPRLDMNSKDLARRFITLIDACYESRTRLFVSSEVPVTRVFSIDRKGDNISDHMRSVMDELGLSTDAVGSNPIFTGEEEVFAFARACSRLVEMGSKDWISQPH